jgi:(2Fe-2S) ferredoxin
MSFAHRIQESEFSLEGFVSGFILGDKGEPKYLTLETASGLCRIKLEKSLRKSPQIQTLASHSSVRVTGSRKLDPHKGKLKLKAYSLELLDLEAVPSELPTVVFRPPVSAKILVCQKSSCRKRGAQNICNVLAQNLVERGLAGEVKIVETGCMKDCKSGPHIVIMPERKRYARSGPSAVGAILDKHFPSVQTAS